MTIAITGPDGFIAWHTRAFLKATTGEDAIHIGRAEFADPVLMDGALTQATSVIHLAGVNRSTSDDEIRTVNPQLAMLLVESLERTGHSIPVVYGNSIHSLGDTIFGQAKLEAANILKAWGERAGAPIVDVVLPNIFGEYGTPQYNSVVATFCHQLANDEEPTLNGDSVIPLLHVQDAAELLVAQTSATSSTTVTPQGRSTALTELLELLKGFKEIYVDGSVPNMSDSFIRNLFNTYRSYTFPNQWPKFPKVNSDDRGDLFETAKAAGGESQVFFSTTKPGYTRGQHYHLRKFERFIVLRGTGVIRLRKLFSDEVVEFPMSGEKPAMVDMPTMWMHSIENTGTDELITLFYADELYDPENPDTYWEDV
ncbi:MAG: NAD-dependent epimerase/dehydratase family protein [Candidatus Nanopelagicales bacterium]